MAQPRWLYLEISQYELGTLKNGAFLKSPKLDKVMEKLASDCAKVVETQRNHPLRPEPCNTNDPKGRALSQIQTFASMAPCSAVSFGCEILFNPKELPYGNQHQSDIRIFSTPSL
ncbi:hypothetical protein BKM12_06080 [Pseudomonas syringae pv. syringae]|nr:hypothetical protein BKM12_06080 [Pseudomonas syringae pv. syringae]